MHRAFFKGHVLNVSPHLDGASKWGRSPPQAGKPKGRAWVLPPPIARLAAPGGDALGLLLRPGLGDLWAGPGTPAFHQSDSAGERASGPTPSPHGARSERPASMRAAPAVDPPEPPSLSSPGGRGPGRGGRGPAPGNRARAGWANRSASSWAPPTGGGARPRRRTARPGGPAGCKDGGGSPGRRGGAGPGRPGCAGQARGRAMSAPPSRPRAAEPDRAPRHGAARGLLRAGGVRAAPAR